MASDARWDDDDVRPDCDPDRYEIGWLDEDMLDRTPGQWPAPTWGAA